MLPKFSVDMRIFSFNLILAMDFLKKIAEFMTVGLAEDTPVDKPKDVVKPIKSIDKSVDSMSVSIY